MATLLPIFDHLPLDNFIVHHSNETHDAYETSIFNIDGLESFIRRSFRISKKLSYLSKYVYSSTSHPYPIQRFYFLYKFNLEYKSFINQISTTYEPQFYHQKITYPKWRNVMA